MRDLRALITWLLHEARAAGGFAREREIWIALAGALLLWTLAYQVPYTHRLDLGGNLQTGRRYDDAPFLDNFNDPEPNPIPDRATLLFRWSRARFDDRISWHRRRALAGACSRQHRLAARAGA